LGLKGKTGHRSKGHERLGLKGQGRKELPVGKKGEKKKREKKRQTTKQRCRARYAKKKVEKNPETG